MSRDHKTCRGGDGQEEASDRHVLEEYAPGQQEERADEQYPGEQMKWRPRIGEPVFDIKQDKRRDDLPCQEAGKAVSCRLLSASARTQP